MGSDVHVTRSLLDERTDLGVSQRSGVQDYGGFHVGVLHRDELARVLNGEDEGPLGSDPRVGDVEGRERRGWVEGERGGHGGGDRQEDDDGKAEREYRGHEARLDHIGTPTRTAALGLLLDTGKGGHGLLYDSGF